MTVFVSVFVCVKRDSYTSYKLMQCIMFLFVHIYVVEGTHWNTTEEPYKMIWQDMHVILL